MGEEALVIQDLAELETCYGEIFEVTMKAQMALEQKRPEEVLASIKLREILLVKLTKARQLLRQHETEWLQTFGLAGEEFRISLVRPYLSQTQYDDIALRLAKVEEVLVQILAADEANHENSVMLQEGIKLEIRRLQSARTAFHASGPQQAEPHFIDTNR